MRIATAWFLSSALALASCNSSKKEEANLDADVSTGGCIVDPSKGPDSAGPIEAATKAEGMICPRGDQDFYVVTVPAGSSLLDVSVSYAPALSKVALQAALYQEDGLTAVAKAVAYDADTADGKSAMASTFAVPAPGRYVLRIADAEDSATDTVNTYVLQVSPAVDPDVHEPNDDRAAAKAADSQTGHFSSAGDVDVYKIAIAKATSLLQLKIGNPVTAKAAIEVEIQDGTGKVLSTANVPPSATPADLTRPAQVAGTLYVLLRYPATAAPDRKAEAGYTIAMAEIADTDPNEDPTRNDKPTSATCLAGAGSPCAAAFTGSAVKFPAQSGSVGSRGDRDVFSFRSTTPGVVEATLKAPATSLDLAVDILVAHPGSPCKADTDCKVLSTTCSEADDCELSHQCVAASEGACTTTNCRKCAAAGVCLPLPDSAGSSACGVIVYSAVDKDGGAKTGSDGLNVVRTAQPIFNAGPVYVVVHDNQDDQYDPATSYTLEVQVAAEPDPLDNLADAAARNNFYNPYPTQSTDLGPNKARAKDITAQITAGTAVAGYISYQSDEDWFWFNHPCPGANCGLVFEWVQPAAASLRPVFFLRTESLSLHESWTYKGTLPTTAPITDSFGDGDCTECSFASAKHTASGTTPYKYYLQVRDAGADDWDFSSSGRYEFRLKTITTGCPASCSERGASICECYCKAQNQCPASIAF